MNQEPPGSNQANLDPERPISRSTNPSDFGPSSYPMLSDQSPAQMPSSSDNASYEIAQSNSMLHFTNTPPSFSLKSQSQPPTLNPQPGFKINTQSLSDWLTIT